MEIGYNYHYYDNKYNKGGKTNNIDETIILIYQSTITSTIIALFRIKLKNP